MNFGENLSDEEAEQPNPQGEGGEEAVGSKNVENAIAGAEQTIESMNIGPEAKALKKSMLAKIAEVVLDSKRPILPLATVCAGLFPLLRDVINVGHGGGIPSDLVLFSHSVVALLSLGSGLIMPTYSRKNEQWSSDF